MDLYGADVDTYWIFRRVCGTSYDVCFAIKFGSMIKRHMTSLQVGDYYQGGPISRYLFLICADVLSSARAYEEEVCGIEGVRMCRNALSGSHLCRRIFLTLF